MKEISVLGVDLAKQVFHIAAMDNRGSIVQRTRLHRDELEGFIASLPPVIIGMESCATSHYWSRVFRRYGHEVKVMAAQFVKPYVKSNKNDTLDAEAIAEAVTRPTMRFVPTKSIDQQDIQSLHRARERLVKSRTALINEMRGLLAEYGIVLPKSREKFRQHIFLTLMEEEEKLTSVSSELFKQLYDELVALEKRVAFYEAKLKAISKSHPVCQRLMTISGVGYLSATAIIAAVGDITCFKNGRGFAAWLGLVPRQHSTGGKPRLGRISKRGNRYLRKLLIHGARANLRYLEGKTDRKSVWATQLKERSGSNKTAVALANKTARAIWAMLARNEDYREFSLAA